jgi:outer membrane protein assembly factor BamB
MGNSPIEPFPHPFGTPVIVNNTIYIVSPHRRGANLYGPDPGIYAINAQTGTQLWNKPD